MSRTRKTYPEEFKREAVAMVERIGNRSQVARELGIDLSLLKLWQKKINANPERPLLMLRSSMYSRIVPAFRLSYLLVKMLIPDDRR
jgi:transposase-like protein